MRRMPQRPRGTRGSPASNGVERNSMPRATVRDQRSWCGLVELQLAEHLELDSSAPVVLPGSPPSARAGAHERVGLEGLELDHVGAGLGRHVDQLERHVERAVVVDARLGDDQDAVSQCSWADVEEVLLQQRRGGRRLRLRQSRDPRRAVAVAVGVARRDAVEASAARWPPRSPSRLGRRMDDRGRAQPALLAVADVDGRLPSAAPRRGRWRSCRPPRRPAPSGSDSALAQRGECLAASACAARRTPRSGDDRAAAGIGIGQVKTIPTSSGQASSAASSSRIWSCAGGRSPASPDGRSRAGCAVRAGSRAPLQLIAVSSCSRLMVSSPGRRR